MSFYYNIANNCRSLSHLCHVVYATKGSTLLPNERSIGQTYRSLHTMAKTSMSRINPTSFRQSSFKGSAIFSLKSKKQLFKIPDFTAADFDTFGLEYFDFALNRVPRSLPFKSPDPTGCGNNPMSGDLWRIRVSFHGLPDSPVGFGSQGVGEFFVGGHSACGYGTQKIVGPFGKCCHFQKFRSIRPMLAV